MGYRQGVVVAVHPEDHSVDLVMTDDGARMTGVQVMTPNGSSRTGGVDLPTITPSGDKWDITKPNKDQDMRALVAYVGRVPVVAGFLYPQINQMLFKDPKMKFYRHQSDVMYAIDGDGNIELDHPSGTYIRIGETPDKVDLSSQNVDKSLKTDRNTGKQVNIRVATGGNTVVLTMTPDGEVSFTCDQDFKIETKANIDFKADGNVLIEAAGNMSLKAGGTINTESGGNTTLKAPTVQADAAFDVTGDTSVKYITSNNKNISDTHTHDNVMAGPAITGPVT
jgi:hypothetical protein